MESIQLSNPCDVQLNPIQNNVEYKLSLKNKSKSKTTRKTQKEHAPRILEVGYLREGGGLGEECQAGLVGGGGDR